MTAFRKLATGQAARELIARTYTAGEPHRADGGPFTLSVAVTSGQPLLIVHDASGRAIGSADLGNLEGVRAAAMRIIHEHKQARLSQRNEAGGGRFAAAEAAQWRADTNDLPALRHIQVVPRILWRQILGAVVFGK
jgi:hypothetical protein